MKAAALALAGILLSSGCGHRARRKDPYAGALAAESAYKHLALALVLSENAKNSDDFFREGGVAWGGADSRVVDRFTQLFKRSFKTVAKVDGPEAAKDLKADLVAVLDVRGSVEWGIHVAAEAVFLTPDSKPLDAVRGKGHQKGGVGVYIPDVIEKAAREFERSMAGSPALSDFARRKLTPAAPPPPPPSPAFNRPKPPSRGEPSPLAAPVPVAPPPPPPAPPAGPSSDIDAALYKLPENEHDFALIVGVEKYQALPDAQFADRDAQAVYKHLLALGYPERNIIMLTGDSATRAGLQKHLGEWLPRSVSPKSTVFFYFSGHGAPDAATKQAGLVPWDAEAASLQSTAYPLKDLYDSLAKLRARRFILALDACFSGAGGRCVLAKGARPYDAKVDAGTIMPRNMVLFTAASDSQGAGTLEAHGHGLFTYHFLKGLSGGAQSRAGAVTADGLYRYLKPKVQDAARRQNREQTPVMRGGEALEALVLFK